MRSIPLVAIRRRAAVALLLLTALTGGSYALQRIDDSRREVSRTIVDVASRQQMLSQRVALLVQALGGSLTPGQRDSARQRLGKSISLMATSQAALRTGTNAVPEATAPTTVRALKAVDGPVRDFLSHARAVAAAPTVAADNPDVRYVRAAAQASLLTGLKNVVASQQAEAEAQRTTMGRLRIALLVAELFVLLAATLLLIQPLL